MTSEAKSAEFNHLACAVEKMRSHSAVGWGKTVITRKEADAILAALTPPVGSEAKAGPQLCSVCEGFVPTWGVKVCQCEYHAPAGTHDAPPSPGGADGLVERLREASRQTITRYCGDLDGAIVPHALCREAAAEIEALRADAERFRALMRCGRIKMQGSSGVDPHTLERNGNGVHFGAEFWPEPPKPEYAHLDGGERSTKWGRACLKALADAILEYEARQALQQGEG